MTPEQKEWGERPVTKCVKIFNVIALGGAILIFVVGALVCGYQVYQLA